MSILQPNLNFFLEQPTDYKIIWILVLMSISFTLFLAYQILLVTKRLFLVYLNQNETAVKTIKTRFGTAMKLILKSQFYIFILAHFYFLLTEPILLLWPVWYYTFFLKILFWALLIGSSHIFFSCLSLDN